MTFLLPGLMIFGILTVIGLGLTLTLLQIRRTRRGIERHVSLIAGESRNARARGAAELFEHREAGWSSVLGRQLRAVFSVLLSHNWGMKAGALTLMLTGSAGAGAAWLMIHLGLHLSDPITLVAMALGFFFAPRMLLKHQQSGADTKFMAVFPDSIDMIIRMLRAGLPVTVAVRSVGDEAPPPVAEVFTSLADQMAIGIAFEDALSAAGQRIGLADFRFFAVAVSLQRATGGNLATTLDILSDIMRKRRGMRLQAKATTGEVRMSAYVLGVIPFLIIGGLLIMTPDYLRPLISDRRGKIIIAVAVTSMLTGFVIIRQMMLSVTRAT